MNYVLDLGIAGAVIICVLVGSHKGAVRMLIAVAGYAAALAAAIFISNAADEYVYDSFVRPAVMSVLEKRTEELEKEYFSAEGIGKILAENGIQLDDDQLSAITENIERYSEVLTKEEFRDTLNSMFVGYCRALTKAFSGVLTDEITAEADRYISETDMGNREKLELLTTDRQSVTELIEREIIRPGMLKTVRTILFFIIFAVVSAAVALISAAAKVIREIPAVRSADGFFGGLLGFLQGIIIAAVISGAAGIFIKLTSDENQYINSGVISETIIFKWVYSGTLFLLSLILK